MRFLNCLLLLLAYSTSCCAAAPVRVGALAFGTLNWELSTIQDAGLDKANGIELSIQTFANPQAGSVALLAGDVDVVVSDWIWVSQQRESGRDFSFSPYSTNHGVLVVPAASPIKGLADLAGKRLGVAGGGLDKNWLMLRALYKEKYGTDLDKAANVVFGAPPLLNEQLQQGKLDVLLDYWHYAAKLEAKGYQPLLTGQDLMHQLGITPIIPSLGYVFRQGWGEQNRPLLNGFLTAARDAKRLLCSSEEAWNKVKPLTQENDPAALASLRRSYCAGQVQRWGEDERQAAAAIYRLIKAHGGAEAAGHSDNLAPGTFWPGTDLP